LNDIWVSPGPLNDIWVSNDKGESWTQKPDPPFSKRHMLGSITIDGVI